MLVFAFRMQQVAFHAAIGLPRADRNELIILGDGWQVEDLPLPFFQHVADEIELRIAL